MTDETSLNADILRAEHSEAYEALDLDRMSDAQERLDMALVADAKAAYVRGVLPVFGNNDRTFFQVVHPSTRVPGKVQITMYNASGALGDTTIDSLDKLPREINYTSCSIIPDDEVSALLDALGAAEAGYQARLAARSQADRQHSPSP